MLQRQFLRVVGGFALLSAIGAATKADQQGVRIRPEKTEIPRPAATAPLDLSTGTPVVTVTINKHLSLKLLVDTGSYATRFDKNLVRRMNLGPVESGFVRIDSLVVGGATFTGVKVQVVEPGDTPLDPRKYSGSLGLSVFADCLMRLDYAEAKLVLFPGELRPADGKNTFDYRSPDGLVTFPLSLGGVTVDVTVDTGSQEAFTLARALKGKVKVGTRSPLARDKGRYLTDVDLAAPTLAGSVSIGRHRLEACPVDFHDGASILGHQILKQFTLRIDQKNRRVQFVRAGTDPVTVMAPSRFGLVFERKGNKLLVAQVLPGTQAQKLGVRRGDSIIALEHSLVSALSDKAIRRLLHAEDYLVIKIDRSGAHLLMGLDAKK